MKIVIPMAGRGTRMRPHTLVTPKPLLPIAGKPIVQRLVEDIASICKQEIDEVAFIVHRSFGAEVEEELKAIAKKQGATGTIHYQDVALGTAHAILSAEPALIGNVVVAFADTLFQADFELHVNSDGIIWTKRVDDPSAFGVVKTDANGTVEEFLEKPEEFVSDQAIIGIYYFNDGAYLKSELQYLIDNDIRIKGGEFGLTDALENMKKKGTNFKIDTVNHWLDCGNKDATVLSNKMVLELDKSSNSISPSAQITDSKIIEPCFIGDDVQISNSVIGPHVSVESGSIIENSCVSNAIVRSNTVVKHANITNSMLGENAKYIKQADQVSIGDYTTLGI